MGTDDSLRESQALRESQVTSRVEKGKHGTIVQTGPVDNVNVTSRERRSQTLPIVVASVAVTALVILAGLKVYDAVGDRQTHERHGNAAPSPSDSANSRTSPAPSSPGPDESGADGKQPEPGEEPPEPSASPGRPGASSGGPPRIKHWETTQPGAEVSGDQASACGKFELCAYREPGQRVRFDFRAPDSDTGDTCHSFPSGDRGFVSVVNGRGYTYYVYDEPDCNGDHRLVSSSAQPQSWKDFRFFSYGRT